MEGLHIGYDYFDKKYTFIIQYNNKCILLFDRSPKKNRQELLLLTKEDVIENEKISDEDKIKIFMYLFDYFKELQFDTIITNLNEKNEKNIFYETIGFYKERKILVKFI
jgi:hypothetical protein